MVEVNKLKPGPIRHSTLTDKQMARIERLQEIFSEVSPQPLEKWVDDFKRDMNPDNELAVWESMATAYQTFVASKTLPQDGKKDAFGVVLLRSCASEEQVLKDLKLNVLTVEEAKELMNLMPLKPSPITAVSP